MIASELVNHTIPFLKPTDSVKKGIDLMDENHLTQLVLTENQNYKGLLNHASLENEALSTTILSEILPNHINTYATINQHITEVLQTVQMFDLDVVAVLDNDMKFKGTISTNDLLKQFSKTLGYQEIGAIIVLAINELDYSLAEIARLIESNNIKIISSYYANSSEAYNFKNTLTLKLNSKAISGVLATLVRFGYDILSTFNNDQVDNPEKENYDMLIKYLEI
jgi:acetoin utilization protein AcuB